MARYRPRSRFRYGRKSGGQEVAVGVAVVIVLAAAGQHAAAPGSRAVSAVRAVAPAGSSYTPASWAAAFLAGGGWPQTACNLAAIQAWEAAEGGQWDNSAQYNPLNTTQPEPGSWTVNSAGVQAFPTWQEGFTANLAVIRNGLYGPVLSALSAGGSAQAVADAVAASPWGTAPFTATC